MPQSKRMYKHKKPKPLKDSECNSCHKMKPLLMPVGYAPGWPYIVYDMLCFECRMKVKNDKMYYWLIQDMIHDKSKNARSAFDEWKDSDINNSFLT